MNISLIGILIFIFSIISIIFYHINELKNVGYFFLIGIGLFIYFILISFAMGYSQYLLLFLLGFCGILLVILFSIQQEIRCKSIYKHDRCGKKIKEDFLGIIDDGKKWSLYYGNNQNKTTNHKQNKIDKILKIINKNTYEDNEDNINLRYLKSDCLIDGFEDNCKKKYPEIEKIEMGEKEGGECDPGYYQVTCARLKMEK